MAKPKMAMIPSTVGGSVYSVLPSNGDGDFDFSRASAATRINAQGLIETVAVGDNRLNYPLLDGTVQTCPHLLLEGQRTNLITYSEDFSNAYYNKSSSTISSGSTISPDGGVNADKLIVNSGSSLGVAFIYPVVTGLTSASAHTFSAFIKKAEFDRVKMLFDDGTNITNRVQATFDVNTGEILAFYANGAFTNASADIVSYGNEWYKCSVSAISTLTISRTRIYPEDSVETVGDGTSGIYIWGAQLEQGSYPTSYIVSNSGSATTRLAEVCNGSGNASTFNSSEGVLMAQIGALADDGTNRYISISDGSTSSVVWIRYLSTSNQIEVRCKVLGATTGLITFTVPDATLISKIAFKYKENDFALWINGIKLGTDTNGITNVANTLNTLNFNDSTSSPFYGKTKQLQYFDSALTDSELETLTSWMSFSDMAIDLNYTIQ
jgi:hypothetical protein